MALVILAQGQHPSTKFAKEFQEFARGKTAKFRCPSEIAFIETLPKTAQQQDSARRPAAVCLEMTCTCEDRDCVAIVPSERSS